MTDALRQGAIKKAMKDSAVDFFIVSKCEATEISDCARDRQLFYRTRKTLMISMGTVGAIVERRCARERDNGFVIRVRETLMISLGDCGSYILKVSRLAFRAVPFLMHVLVPL